jgi:hypothetical protein
MFQPICANRLLVHRNALADGRNFVGHDAQRTCSRFHACGNVEVGANKSWSGGDFQGAVAVHPRVKDVAGAVVGDPYQRILRGGLELVAEGDGLERPLNCISEISRSPA